jgi:hypothetical protein
MANTHKNLTSLFDDIADKIRAKTGTNSPIIADNFPDAIENILTPADGSISTKTASDMTVSDATITIPAGYYSTAVSKAVDTTTHPNPTATINTSTGVVTASHT